LGDIKKNKLLQRTAAGDLDIHLVVESDHVKIMMRQSEPERVPMSEESVLKLKNCFLSSVSNPFHDVLPIEIWSTGLKDIMVGVKTRKILNTLTPDFKQLSSLSKELDVIGAHVFSIDSDKIYARNFAPLYGIDEESATGTSNGALASYLHHHLKGGEPTFKSVVLQGESMNATSSITVESRIGPSGHEIWVGGSCHWVKTINIQTLI